MKKPQPTVVNMTRLGDWWHEKTPAMTTGVAED